MGGPAARPHRRGRGAPGRLLPRGADLVVPLAQGDPAGARRRLSLRRARLPGLRALRQAHGPRVVHVRPPRRGDAGVRRRARPRDAVAVVHDWGGPIGLRLAVENPERFSAIVVMDTGRLHRPSGDVGGLAGVPRLRRANRGPADLDARLGRDRARRWTPRSSRPTTRRSRRPSRRPARAPFRLLIPTSPEMPGARRGDARARGAGRGRAAEAPPLG